MTRTWMVSVLESVLPVEVASIEAALAASIVRSRPAMATLLRTNASAEPWTWLPTNAPPTASACAVVVELSSATSCAVSSARTVMSRALTRRADDGGLGDAADVVARDDAVVALRAAVVEPERLDGGRRDRLRDDRRVVELLPELEVGVVLRAEIAGLRRAHVLVEALVRRPRSSRDAHAVAEGERPRRRSPS